MTDERLIVAVGRLERALARLEIAESRRTAAPPRAPADEALRARHARLRESTQAAIAKLDDLLGAQAPRSG